MGGAAGLGRRVLAELLLQGVIAATVAAAAKQREEANNKAQIIGVLRPTKCQFDTGELEKERNESCCHVNLIVFSPSVQQILYLSFHLLCFLVIF